MIFYADIIVQLSRFFPDKGPFPTDIQITAFSKSSTHHPGLKISGRGLDHEPLFFKTDIRYPNGFMNLYPRLSGNSGQGGVDLITTDTKTAERQFMFQHPAIGS